MNTNDIDLNVPYSSLKPLEETVETSVEETPLEVKENEEEAPEAESVEETKVPYSRFKNVHQRAIDAEKEAEIWRQRAESFNKPNTAEETTVELPDAWKRLYGDSDESVEAWKLQMQMNKDMKEEARREAIEAIKNERNDEISRTESNIEEIDENLDRLSAFVGRDLTEKEQSAILDIVDEYTPQDAEGNYLGATLPFEKAWEIYDLKQQATKAPQRQARDSVASLNSQGSEGETNISENDKSWNPSDWFSYKKRL